MVRPNHRWGCDKEALANTTDRKANQLGRNGQQPLVYFAIQKSRSAKEDRAESELELTAKRGMLVIKDFLNGDNVCLKNVVRAWTEQNSADMICQVGTTHTICGGLCDTSHDSDDDVLFNGKGPRVNKDAKEGNIWHVSGPGFANRET